MTFYFKPPRGHISLFTINECALTRLNYCLNKYNARSEKEGPFLNKPSDFEYLICNSAYDRTGHYILRLFSHKSNEIKAFLSTCEMEIFLDRLENLTPGEIKNFIRVTLRHVEESTQFFSSAFSFYSSLKMIFKDFYSKEVLLHFQSFRHDESCLVFTMNVPFTLCLPLVASRKVALQKGYALVPCGMWKTLFTYFFQMHFDFGIAEMKQERCFENALRDSRMLELMNELHHCYKTKLKGKPICSAEVLNAASVNAESAYFPPCMLSLYRTLRTKHRLSHQARFHFSLFLKDIGMPLNEALSFWQQEYSQSSTCTGCVHSWQKDAAKYQYSIRHLYGLEGSKKIYKSPNCDKIKERNISPTADGGCPFVSFDNSSLKLLLDSVVVEDKSIFTKIITLKEKKKPEEACHLYLSAISNKTNSQQSFHNMPLWYYTQRKRNER